WVSKRIGRSTGDRSSAARDSGFIAAASRQSAKSPCILRDEILFCHITINLGFRRAPARKRRWDGMTLAEYPDDMAFATAIGVRQETVLPDTEEGQVPDRLMDEARLFRRLGLSKPLISAMLVQAGRHGTTLEAEVLA